MKPIFETNTNNEVLKVNESNVFINPISQVTTHSQLGIEKITLDENYTRIDFVYISPTYYINGGWIQINSNCYIRAIGSVVHHKLVRAINIPIAPAKYYFKNKGQVHHFTLIFPALPKAAKQIDVVERLADGNFFNFFRVELQHQEPTFIRIFNGN